MCTPAASSRLTAWAGRRSKRWRMSGREGAYPSSVTMPATGRRVGPAVPLAVAVPLVVVAGVVLDAAFPSVGAWALAFPSLVALLLSVRGRGLRSAYGLGVLYGLGFMVPQLQWSGIYVGPLPWLALSTLQALMLALVAPLWVLAWRLAERWLWTFPLMAGATWVAVEALRARVPFGGFGWGRLAFSQADSPLVDLAVLAGAPLVSFGVSVVAAAFALVVVGLLPDRSSLVRRARLLAPATVAGVAVGAVSALLVPAALVDTVRPGDGSVRVAAVQGDVPRAGLDFNAQRRAVLDNHANATLELAARIEAGEEEPVDLVLWPENASDIDPLRNPDADEVISAAADAIGVPIVLGAVLREPADALTNAILVWEPGTGFRGREDGLYAKQALAPFGEYIPYRDFFRVFSPLVDNVTDFVPGEESVVLDVGGARLGVGICFEVLPDDVLREHVRNGADLLVVPTNNATFGFTDEAVQQLAMSRLRAVEHGRSLVHVSTVGVSAIVAPDGSTGPRTELFEPAVLTTDVELRSGLTPATVLGAAPEWVLVGLTLLLVVWSRGRAPAGRMTGGHAQEPLTPADTSRA